MNDLYFWPSAFCKVDDIIWFVYGRAALLCKYEISKGKTKIVEKIPVNDMFRECLFMKMVAHDNKLFMLPCWADDIIVYDLDKEVLNVIPLISKDIMKLSNAYLFDDKLLCIPYAYPSIIKLDIHTLDKEDIYDLTQIFDDNGVKYFNDNLILGNEILMVSLDSNCVWIYDIQLNKLTSKCINQVDGISYIAKVGTRIVLCSNTNKKILICNTELMVIREFWIEGKELLKVSEFDDEYFLIDDFKSEYVSIADFDGNIMGSIASDRIENRSDYHLDYGGIIENYDVENVYFDQSSASFKIFDKKNKYTYKNIKMLIDDEIKDYLRTINFISNHKSPIRESSIVSLDLFISNVTRFI